MAGASVKTVSKNIICSVVATCCGELAESTEIFIPGIGDCAYNLKLTKTKIINNSEMHKLWKHVHMVLQQGCFFSCSVKKDVSSLAL